MAVAVLLRGSNSSKRLFLQPQRLRGGVEDRRQSHPPTNRSYAACQGAVFSADSRYLYIGNYIDQDISILRVGDQLVDTGKSVSCLVNQRRCGER
jgi:hypothetical protein